MSCGFMPNVVAQGQLQLPVDDWQEVEAIATAWLSAVGDTTLRLGKIHQLENAYLLTIVDQYNGQTVRHRIVIGMEDGRVAVL